jgi:predicted AAA+ superfamily ATPase
MHDKMHLMFKRAIRLPHPPAESFFLWGPRQCGKTTLLRQTYPDARWIDLLRAEEYSLLSAHRGPDFLPI